MGTWLVLRSRTPAWKKYLFPRLTLVGSAIPAAFFSVPSLLRRDWNAALFVLVGVGLFTYLVLSTVRVCDNCGKVAEPRDLNGPPKNCPKCGARLLPFGLSDSRPSA